MITVENTVRATIDKVWDCWNEPQHITKWAFASDDWEAPSAQNDLRTGGKLIIEMAAKDRSAGFELIGVYSTVLEKKLIEYSMSDGRRVRIEFHEVPDGVHVVESFDPEQVHSEDLQRQGWQAILDNFKKYTESRP